jgi:hypothetical protein
MAELFFSRPAVAKLAAVLCGAAMLASGGSASGASKAADHPDLSGFWRVTFEPGKLSGQALVDELPKGTILIHDTGPGELKAGDYGGLKLTQRALDEVKRYSYESEVTTENNCIPPSMAFLMQAPFPMEIFQGRDLIVLKMEYFDMVRIVFMDGRSHMSADGPHSKAGNSIGHWEGDTLVVDTDHLEAGTFMNNGFNHSTKMHVIEKFRLSPDGNTLWATQLYDDPDTFEGYSARYLIWRKVAGDHVYPYDCDPTYNED